MKILFRSISSARVWLPMVGVVGGVLPISCGLFGGGEVIDNQAKILSTSLNVAPSSGLRRLLVNTGECSSSSTTCTPSGLSGRVYAAGAMLGGLGNDAYSLTFLADSDEVIQDPSVGYGGTLLFDVLNDDPVSGKASIPSEGKMPANPVVDSVEFRFDYLDSKIKLTGTSGADGEYTVRTVFVTAATSDDVTGTMYRGDKLIKGSSDTKFKWCSAAGCSETRPTTPYQVQSLLDWEPRGQGGEYYPIVDFDILAADQKTFDHATLADTTKIWKVDLNVTDVVTWSSAPSGFTTVAQIVQNFGLDYDSDDGDSLTATFDIVAAE